jgi:hypothetical protein
VKRIDARTVEFTDVELIIRDWHADLMDRGLSQDQAVLRILGLAPYGEDRTIMTPRSTILTDTLTGAFLAYLKE